MRYKIIVGSKTPIEPEEVDDVIQALHHIGYTAGEFNIMYTCDGCETELPQDWKSNVDGDDLCPNCETGKQDAMKGSI